jgi:iron complex outermembrane receptor protein
VIGTPDIQATVDANDPRRVHRTATGQIASVDMFYENLAYMKTDGFEVTFRRALPTSYGTFQLSGDWAYVWHFKMPVGNHQVDYAGTNGALNQPFGAAFSRWKGNTSVSWNYRKFTTSLTWEYTGLYSQVIADQDSNPGVSKTVASYSQFNLFASYSGFKGWTLYGGINNLANKKPPFDPVWMSYYSGYDTSLYTYVGRFFQVGATYRFM